MKNELTNELNGFSVPFDVLINSHKKGRDATEEEQNDFELTLQSERMILIAQTGELFLYGTEIYDLMEEEYKSLWHQWGRKNLSKMMDLQKRWERKILVDQLDGIAKEARMSQATVEEYKGKHKTTVGTQKTFYCKHYYDSRMQQVMRQIEYSIRVSLGKHGIVENQELIAKLFLYRSIAESLVEVKENFLDTLASYRNSISNENMDTAKRLLLPYLDKVTIQNPHYMADPVFKFISKETYQEMMDEPEIQRCMTAYGNVYDRTWTEEGMVESMEINGDPDAEDFRRELGLGKETPETEDLREYLMQQLQEKEQEDRWKVV